MKSILTGLLGLLLSTSGGWASTINLTDNTFTAIVHSSAGPILGFDETVDGVTFNFAVTGGAFRAVGTWATGTNSTPPFYADIGGGSGSAWGFTLISSADVTLNGFSGLAQQFLVNPLFDVTGNGVSSLGNTFDVVGSPVFAAPSLNSFVGGVLTLLAGETYTFDITNGGSTTLGFIYGIDFDVVGAPPSAVPLPASLPLFAAGLGIMGYLGSRRKRKKTAA